MARHFTDTCERNDEMCRRSGLLDEIESLQRQLAAAKAEAAAAQERERELQDKLRKLANEASGFLSMADKETHGVTNMRVLGLRINEARAALSTEPRQAEPTEQEIC